MALVAADLKLMKSAEVSDASTNGGRMSTTAVTSGAVQNFFPNVFSSERTSGSTKYRKGFLKLGDTSNGTLFEAGVYIAAPTAANDYVVFFEGNFTNTQANITGSERIYGAGVLKTQAAAAGTTLVVNVENSGITGIFQAGDLIKVNDELLTIDSVSVSGVEVTITTTTALAETHAIGDEVASICELGDIEGSVGEAVVTSSAGTFDDTSYPITLPNNLSAIYQTWTLTFTDATNFTVVGDSVGAVASGTISSNHSPNNSNFSYPYFTIDADAFGGTFVNGDTIVFVTTPPAKPIWEKRVVPAGSSAFSNNLVTLVWYGEVA